MRATGRLCALLCALLALLPASVARAKIAPLPKPAGIAAAPAGGHSGSLIAPVSRPAVRTTVKPVLPHVVTPRRTQLHRTTPAVRRHALIPASSQGGRERLWRVLSSGGREAPALTARGAVVPTPLGFVSGSEPLPVAAYGWPAWKVMLLTLFAVAEAFVLVRLARERRFTRTSGI
jgi:hypothetical protein